MKKIALLVALLVNVCVFGQFIIQDSFCGISSGMNRSEAISILQSKGYKVDDLYYTEKNNNGVEIHYTEFVVHNVVISGIEFSTMTVHCTGWKLKNKEESIVIDYDFVGDSKDMKEVERLLYEKYGNKNGVSIWKEHCSWRPEWYSVVVYDKNNQDIRCKQHDFAWVVDKILLDNTAMNNEFMLRYDIDARKYDHSSNEF